MTKTFPLKLEDAYLNAIRRTARQHGLSIKDFIKKAIDISLSPDDYFIAHPDIIKTIQGANRNTLVKMNSIKDLFD